MIPSESAVQDACEEMVKRDSTFDCDRSFLNPFQKLVIGIQAPAVCRHYMYPTPYLWETKDGSTHILYDNHLHPSTEFGWSSICSEVRLPIEGEHFELNEDVTNEEISCPTCRNSLDKSYPNSNKKYIASFDGCLVMVDRDDQNVIYRADLVCKGGLHRFLPFEMDTFEGNLTKQVEEVCSDCWETYVDKQWARNAEGGELRVEVCGEDDRSEYFAVRAEAKGGDRGELRLVSENNLKKDLPRQKIGSVERTPTRQVQY